MHLLKLSSKNVAANSLNNKAAVEPRESQFTVAKQERLGLISNP